MSDHPSPKPADPAASPAAPTGEPKGLPPIDVNEYGGKRDGVRQQSNRRLFMQLMVFDVPTGGDADTAARQLGAALRDRAIPGVVYADTMDPRGVGLLTWSEDPALFATKVRTLFNEPFEPMNQLRHVSVRREFGMLGRTYSTGHEPDLADTLMHRPIRQVLNESHTWARLVPAAPHRGVCQARPARAVGDPPRARRARDGLRRDRPRPRCSACVPRPRRGRQRVRHRSVGPELHPLSHLVQAMRKTKQTSEYIAKMGPFFVGHVVSRNPG